MGTVYKADDRQAGRVVAVKVLAAERVPDERSNMRFQQEAKALAKLDHPCIAKVYGQGVTESGEPYLVMEFLEGSTLAEKIASEGQQPIEEMVRISIQVCDGLAHAHARKILHRDLKPSNIMLTTAGESNLAVKILDFGIARMQENPESPSLHLTKTGELLGSPFYMSPEQAKGGRVDERSDLYSLGATLYEALTGGPPHVGQNPMSTLLRRELDQPILMSEASMGRSFPEELEVIGARLLNRNPEDRYPSALEVKRDLVKLLKAGFAGPRSPNTRQRQAKPVSSATRSTGEITVYAFAVLIFLLVVLLPKVLFERRTSSPSVDIHPAAELHLWFSAATDMSAGERHLERHEYAEAERLLRRAIAKYTQKFGESIEEVGEGYENLALLYQAQSKSDLELGALEKAVTIESQQEKQNNLKLADLNNRLGSLYSRASKPTKERYVKGARCYEKAAALYELDAPKRISDLNNCYLGAGLCFRGAGEYRLSQQWFLRALQLAKRHRAACDPYTVSIQDELASCYRDQGLYDSALKFANDSLLCYKKSPRPDLKRFYFLLILAGEAHFALSALSGTSAEDLRSADSMYRQALKLCRSNRSFLPDEELDVLIRLLTVNTLLGKCHAHSYYQQALKLRDEVLRQATTCRPPNLPLNALAFEKLGDLHRNLGNSRLMRSYYAQSRQCFITGARQFERRGMSAEAASLFFQCARMEENLGNLAVADRLYAYVTPIMEKHIGRENRNFVNILFCRGYLLNRLQKYEQARDCFAQAHEIECQLLGPDNLNTKAALNMRNNMDQAIRSAASNSTSK